MMGSLDDEAFKGMVEVYAPVLFRTAVWLGADRATAEDLVQETFARAWRSRRSLQDLDRARAWLVTILRREHARLYERQRPEPLPQPLVELDVQGSWQVEPADRIAVRRAVASLDPMYRDPLIMQVLWGFSCKEIAQLLDLSPGGAMTRLFRARQQLRETLDQPPESQRREGRR